MIGVVPEDHGAADRVSVAKAIVPAVMIAVTVGLLALRQRPKVAGIAPVANARAKGAVNVTTANNANAVNLRRPCRKSL